MPAIYALKLKDYHIPNMNYWISHTVFGELDKYPLEQINAFFNTLQIEGFLTGYAQINNCPTN